MLYYRKLWEGNELNNQIVDIPIHQIIANPHQPRQVFDEDSLNELAQSILHHGLIQPVVLRQNNHGAYELIAGERRLRASKIAGLETIQAIIKETSDRDSAYLALIENIQRDDLHFIEVAKSYRELIVRGGGMNMEVDLHAGITAQELSPYFPPWFCSQCTGSRLDGLQGDVDQSLRHKFHKIRNHRFQFRREIYRFCESVYVHGHAYARSKQTLLLAWRGH